MTHEDGEAPVLEVVTRTWAEELRAELTQAKDLRLRAAADLDNYRKRAAREKEDAVRYANEALLSDLLPAVDALDLGLEHVATAPDANAVAAGMRIAVNQLLTALRQHGLEPIEARGQPFDPHSHEAVSQQEVPGAAEGEVVQQLRKGFRLNGRLLRPATVVVAKAPAASAANG